MILREKDELKIGGKTKGFYYVLYVINRVWTENVAWSLLLEFL